MTPNDYQAAALRTLNNQATSLLTNKQAATINCLLGLAGELGEFIDAMKKSIFHGHDMPDAKEELGDIQWYLAVLAALLGVTLDDIMTANIAKLRARYPDGFTHAASIHRKV